MKNRIRKVTATAAIALTMTAMLGAIPASAANTETGQTNFTMFVPNDPVYTITVPETVVVDTENITDVPVTASDVKYIPEGKKISVTYKRGSGNFGRFYLSGTNPEDGKEYLMTMKIKGANDTEYKSGALEKQVIGLELASFTEDGTINYQVYPVAFDYPNSTNANLTIQKGVNYSAYVTYGIALVDDTAATAE